MDEAQSKVLEHTELLIRGAHRYLSLMRDGGAFTRGAKTVSAVVEAVADMVASGISEDETVQDYRKGYQIGVDNLEQATDK